MAEMPANLPGPRAYHEERLALGVPEGGDFGSEKIFALDAGLDELNGVVLHQGLLCRPGTDLADEASRHGPQAHSDRDGATPRCPRPARRCGAAARRSANCYLPTARTASPWYGWTGWKKPAATSTVGEIPVALTQAGMARLTAWG